MTKIEDEIINEVEEEIHPKTIKAKIWEITKTILKIAVTSILLYFVFKKVPFADVKYRLIHANYWWMLAALISFFISIVISSSRLLSFFKSINLKLSAQFNFRLFLLGLFYNFLLPGGIGGDGYKIYLLNKTYKLPAKKVFWAIMFDRLSGLWAMGFIIVSLIFLIPNIDINLSLPIGIFLIGSFIYAIIVFRFFKDYTQHFFTAHLKALFVQGFQVLSIIFILLSQNFQNKYPPYLISHLISSLIAAVIPITAGGAGMRETVFTKIAEQYHMDKTLAVFLPGIFYIVSLLVALLGIYYVLRPSSLDKGLSEMNKI